MRKLLLLASILFLYQFATAQNTESKIQRNCLTIGVLQGGGSLLGLDYEFMPFSKIGLQAGAGFMGFGCGINYHLIPWARSPLFSLQYWHQGIDKTYIQSLIGPSFVYRARKVFSFQIGMGFLIEKGPKYNSVFKREIPVMLTYAIGVYLPW